MEEKYVRLTSSEISSLWTLYMNDSMAVIILGFMLQHIQDKEVKNSVKMAYNIATSHKEKLQEIFAKENFAQPYGFSQDDVNMQAPWLFSDIFCLTYINHMAKVGVLAYGGFVSMSARKDIRSFFTKSLHETIDLFNQTTDTALNKGVFNRHPIIEVPKESDYIASKKYLSGLNPFSKKRSLNAIEITHLFMNILTNSIGVKLCGAFAQTSNNDEVKEFMLRGKEISQKHINVFSELLLNDDIQVTQVPDASVSTSTTKTFSDKLLMFHMSLLSSAGTGNYATAAAASQRADLAIQYERLSLEIAQFAKSGADIMITHSWLEEPPGTVHCIDLIKPKME